MHLGNVLRKPSAGAALSERYHVVARVQIRSCGRSHLHWAPAAPEPNCCPDVAAGPERRKPAPCQGTCRWHCSGTPCEAGRRSSGSALTLWEPGCVFVYRAVEVEGSLSGCKLVIL